MQIDFVEVETKNKRTTKIIMIIIIAVLLIVNLSLFGIIFAKKYNETLIAKRDSIINNIKEEVVNNEIKEENEIENNIVKDVEIEKNTITPQSPIYSEEAKTAMKNIYSTETKIAYLTFDDGPSQAVTPLILDILKQENVKATFFVLGSNVENNPDLLRREYEEGHYIANHGYSHKYSSIYSNENGPLEEYQRTELCIQQALGNPNYNSHLFRFPGGYYGGKYAGVKELAGQILNDNNISFIDWNCLSGDAEGANTKEKIMEYIQNTSQDKNNLVILMHDASTKILTYEALPDIIQYLRDLGYSFDNFYNIMK